MKQRILALALLGALAVSCAPAFADPARTDWGPGGGAALQRIAIEAPADLDQVDAWPAPEAPSAALASAALAALAEGALAAPQRLVAQPAPARWWAQASVEDRSPGHRSDPGVDRVHRALWSLPTADRPEHLMPPGLVLSSASRSSLERESPAAPAPDPVAWLPSHSEPSAGASVEPAVERLAAPLRQPVVVRCCGRPPIARLSRPLGHPAQPPLTTAMAAEDRA